MPASTRATRTRAVFSAALADTACTLLVGQAIFWPYWTLLRDVSFLSLGRRPCAYLVFSTLVAVAVAPTLTTFARGALFDRMVRGDSLLAEFYHGFVAASVAGVIVALYVAVLPGIFTASTAPALLGLAV